MEMFLITMLTSYSYPSFTTPGRQCVLSLTSPNAGTFALTPTVLDLFSLKLKLKLKLLNCMSSALSSKLNSHYNYSGEGTAKGAKRKSREPPRSKKARCEEFADLKLCAIPGLLVTRTNVTTIQTHEEYRRSLALREQAARKERSRALLQALCDYIGKEEAEENTAYGAKLDSTWDECQ